MTRIRGAETDETEEVPGELLVLPMPGATNPDNPRAFTERVDGEGPSVEISYVPMGPPGSLAISRVVRQPVSSFRPGEMVFVETGEKDRRGRTIWKLCRVL